MPDYSDQWRLDPEPDERYQYKKKKGEQTWRMDIRAPQSMVRHIDETVSLRKHGWKTRSEFVLDACALMLEKMAEEGELPSTIAIRIKVEKDMRTREAYKETLETMSSLLNDCHMTVDHEGYKNALGHMIVLQAEWNIVETVPTSDMKKLGEMIAHTRQVLGME